MVPVHSAILYMGLKVLPKKKARRVHAGLLSTTNGMSWYFIVYWLSLDDQRSVILSINIFENRHILFADVRVKVRVTNENKNDTKLFYG